MGFEPMVDLMKIAFLKASQATRPFCHPLGIGRKVYIDTHFKLPYPDISGQSYKQFTLVNYDASVVSDLKTPHITTLGS